MGFGVSRVSVCLIRGREEGRLWGLFRVQSLMEALHDLLAILAKVRNIAELERYMGKLWGYHLLSLWRLSLSALWPQFLHQ